MPGWNGALRAALTAASPATHEERELFAAAFGLEVREVDPDPAMALRRSLDDATCPPEVLERAFDRFEADSVTLASRRDGQVEPERAAQRDAVLERNSSRQWTGRSPAYDALGRTVLECLGATDGAFAGLMPSYDRRHLEAAANRLAELETRRPLEPREEQVRALYDAARAEADHLDALLTRCAGFGDRDAAEEAALELLEIDGRFIAHPAVAIAVARWFHFAQDHEPTGYQQSPAQEARATGARRSIDRVRSRLKRRRGERRRMSASGEAAPLMDTLHRQVINAVARVERVVLAKCAADRLGKDYDVVRAFAAEEEEVVDEAGARKLSRVVARLLAEQHPGMGHKPTESRIKDVRRRYLKPLARWLGHGDDIDEMLEAIRVEWVPWRSAGGTFRDQTRT